MSDDMNLADRPASPTDDLINKASRFSAFGWIAFFITLMALILQNLIYQLKPNPVLATVNGEVVGQVIFDEARTRATDRILSDIKQWVQACTTANKNTVYEDLSICLNHMDKDLANAKLAEYEKSNYAPSIASFGCERTNTVFQDAATSIKRDPLSLAAFVSIEGEVQCIESGKSPLAQAFAIEIQAELVGRTTNAPLAIRVTDFWDKGVITNESN